MKAPPHVQHPTISPDALDLKRLALMQGGAISEVLLRVERNKDCLPNQYVLWAKSTTRSQTDDSNPRGYISQSEEPLDQSTVEKIQVAEDKSAALGCDCVLDQG